NPHQCERFPRYLGPSLRLSWSLTEAKRLGVTGCPCPQAVSGFENDGLEKENLARELGCCA
ncbi:MAG: hypothetical protein ACRED2_05755, partial [Methylocella sp.]